MQFDDDQSLRLRPLVESQAVVRFPFFANTFSLGYHYAKALASQRGRSIRRHELLDLHDWGVPKPFRSFTFRRPRVFYATSKTVAELRKELEEHNKKGPPYELRVALFTRYHPRLFFIQHGVRLKQITEEQRLQSRSEFCEFTEQVAAHLDRNYDIIEIFTDIRDQAFMIQDLLASHGVRRQKIVIIKSWREAFSFPGSASRVLRVYFYGAPVTTKLKKEHHVIPFALPEHIPEHVRDLFRTHICVVQPILAGKETLATNLIGALREYHGAFLSAAEGADDEELLDVWWAYNRYAELLRHNSAFESTKEFASCLTFHHKQED